MKTTIKIFLIFIVNAIVMDYVDAGVIGFQYAVILAVADFLMFSVFLMCEKKKSATCAKRNGQAHKEHIKYIHHNCTPKKGGVSSV